MPIVDKHQELVSVNEDEATVAVGGIINTDNNSFDGGYGGGDDNDNHNHDGT